ncbi:ABC transporter permease subunit [Motiliproteus sp. MSK22-1]|uniref:ABC transporter permease subunit n=1 Tax=Motiliproteus sp. MSK22-1 TaxID=1897630 RepID=UPI0009756E6C|nr:ABC transporter permease subunit [Motiliproteus sp. MSK22-1]OMH33799.1 thiamine/thiamine pyrophosphate ABC transporter permease ThiP [Motiliproteus sp. MSK22-1]
MLAVGRLAVGRLGAGQLGLLFIALVTLLSFQGLIGFSANGNGGSGPDWSLLSDTYFRQVLWFSIQQAGLSALLSMILAWPVARAIYYLPELIGRQTFLSLCILCFVMPTLVLITGLVSLLGRSGILTPWLGESWNLYGLNGILLAHIYLNMPFAVRVLVQQMNTIPDSSWKLATQLKFTPWQRLKHIEWPSVKASYLMLFGFIFVLCFNSFAVVLALGGGPKATTLEVAIYQALKYDFNIPEALMLAWTQFLIAGSLFLALTLLGSISWLSADTATRHWVPTLSSTKKACYQTIYYLAWLVLLLPIVALFAGIDLQEISRFSWSSLLEPTAVSIALGLIAAVSATITAYLILQPIRNAYRQRQHRQRIALEWIATHTLVAPAMVLSVGLFIFLLPKIDLDDWGIVFVALLNMVVLVPFAFQQLKPRLFQFDQQYMQLSSSLKLQGFSLLRVEWPFIRPVFVASLALVLILAIGDVAIFSIFGSQDWTTLPWLIYSYAGTYRIAEASIASLLLLALCSLILWAFERFRSHVEH